ncbi:uncharacterized protein LOC131935306 isoform X2 [Physella acuta]|uniref:uncharacterized protein LOC131935306 isoform X2 n=1 Tax=Physella acuta TaxID=109671 RepID=UPI0027DDEFDC|nr:uncharacterized protein LOC131935306 isoform X2 [Physella acuta]
MPRIETGTKFLLLAIVAVFGLYQIYVYVGKTQPNRPLSFTPSHLDLHKNPVVLEKTYARHAEENPETLTQIKLLRAQVQSFNETVQTLWKRLNVQEAKAQEVKVQEVKVKPIVNVVPSFPNESLPRPQNCVHLAKAPPGVTICTHDAKEDVWISGAIQGNRLWEDDLMTYMMKVLREHPNMQLVDLGANVGEYTLMAASLGRHVVAVDILDSNIQLLQHSLKLSNLSHLVTVVKNAIYRDRSLKLGFKTYSGNIGGTAVVENSTAGDIVQSICLDDLIPLVKSKSVYVKMDIETSEHHALACGKEFFSSLDVKVIQMEWSGKTEQAAKEIGEFADKFGYTTHVLSAGQLRPKDIDVQFRGDYIFVKN